METERFLERMTKSLKKSKRSLRRLCGLHKSRAGMERMIKGYESFCRAFGETKAYALACMFVLKLNAAEIMEIRTNVKQLMIAKMKFREHLTGVYKDLGRDITKSDKVAERKFIKTHRMLSQELSNTELEDVEVC